MEIFNYFHLGEEKQAVLRNLHTCLVPEAYRASPDVGPVTQCAMVADKRQRGRCSWRYLFSQGHIMITLLLIIILGLKNTIYDLAAVRGMKLK